MAKIDLASVKEVSDVFDGTLLQAMLDKKSNDNYQYTDLTARQIYTNILLDGIKEFDYIHEGIEYHHNKKTYRSKEFSSGTDILITGCSHTYGTGLDEEFRWGDILSNKLGLTHSNLGVPGSGVTKQVRDIFAYFKEFGHPKYIFALFPVFNRFEIASNPKYLKHGAFDRLEEHQKIPTPWHEPFRQTANICMIPGNQKFLSKPLIAEDVIPSEIPQFYSSMYVQMLQQYCDIAGIKFAWGTWHQQQYYVLSQVNDQYPGTYKNMINMYSHNWAFDKRSEEIYYIENETIVNCHEDYKNAWGKQFHAALDRQYGAEHSHFGGHKNIHIAEAFEKFFNENWKNND